MAVTYITREGDMADQIAWEKYGTRKGRMLERLLEANPGLADYGPVLPAGVSVVIPDLVPEPDTTGSVRLWD